VGTLNPGKSWNLKFKFSRPGKSYKLLESHGKSLKIQQQQILFARKKHINTI